MTTAHPTHHAHHHARPVEVPSSGGGLADQLKAATAELHTRAERHPLQGGLLQGRLDIASFAALQSQMDLVHQALEGHIAALRATEPSLGKLVKDYHFRAPLIARDLADLGVDRRSIMPLAPTSALVRAMAGHAARQPVWFVGALYVLEGSTNGAVYIKKALQRAYNIQDSKGLTYLDPHGEAQRPRWAQFREELSALPLDEVQKQVVFQAANDIFLYMIEVMDALTAAKN